MRRNRGAILHPLLFCLALFLIIYANRESSPTQPRIFPWTTVRYTTRAAALPAPHGVCPGLDKTTKPALVVARISSEDFSWLSTPDPDGPDATSPPLTTLYHPCIYTADAPPAPPPSADRPHVLRTPANRAHEAMAYLTFIVDNYAHLPAAAVFVHGARFQWHNDHPLYDNRRLLARLDVASALGPHGYHNLRCDWGTGTCPADVRPQGSVETRARAALELGNARAVSDAALPAALRSIFGQGAGEVGLGRGDAVRAQCCAQFVVARENIRRHSRDEYVALRQWLLDGMVDRDGAEEGEGEGEGGRLRKQTPGRGGNGYDQPAPADDLVAGRVLSYVWHILFLPAAEGDGVDLARLNERACPSAEECYCRVYGRCGLEGCAAGRCRGQYRVPPEYKLPGDWAEKHG